MMWYITACEKNSPVMSRKRFRLFRCNLEIAMLAKDLWPENMAKMLRKAVESMQSWAPGKVTADECDKLHEKLADARNSCISAKSSCILGPARKSIVALRFSAASFFAKKTVFLIHPEAMQVPNLVFESLYENNHDGYDQNSIQAQMVKIIRKHYSKPPIMPRSS